MLKNKSQFNTDAAILLQEKNLYAPSVHCSYYSCLQLMKFIIKDFIGISYVDLEIEIRQKNTNTHKLIIEKISDELYKNSRTEYTYFNRKIKDLKKFRVSSDYENVQITTVESGKALVLAKEVREQLIKNFHV